MSDKLSKRISLGCIPYINALPFSLQLAKHKEIDLYTASPAELLTLLIHRKLNNALTSSFGAISHKLNYLPDFGIAAHKRILSVNLYTVPTFFNGKHTRLVSTQESRSSIELLKILCHYLWRVPIPEILRLPTHEVIQQSSDNCTGLLLIGDAALHHPKIPGFTTYDLAAGWYDLTQLPFVFAIILHNTSGKEESLLSQVFTKALNYFETHPQEVVQEAYQRTRLPKPLLQEYFTLCQYKLEDEHYESLARFQTYHEALCQSA
ncbi:menaquinone biosynthesis protein [Candidatus Chlamydia sanziniae]|uniref:Chorismate dehydratase n=1 Tax=Candidatus Chlamydia sanziniae TaxID=1806891 RepID=A0A1A9HTI8_9CHLA|nr:menaquinone biosynthesis protein [Candidatus Chlamydia sanziniae]ANH78310.1 Chorismate dehydratase [Candidatus Chlamydia sanziniae]